MSRVIFSIVGFIMLSGCSWLGIEDNSYDYLNAQEAQVTVVPENLDSTSLGQLYPIPKLSQKLVADSTGEIPRPQPISVNTFEQLVKIQKIDEKRWILVNSAPSKLWPRIRNILNKSGLPTLAVNASAGIIETDWLAYKSDEANEHRFKFMISPGVQINSTEIAVIHQQKLIDSVQQDWNQISDTDAKEEDMISFLAGELAASQDFASVSMLAQEIGGSSKVEIVNPEAADPFIQVNLDFERTWASINYSAVRGGFTLVDRDRSQGHLLVAYSSELQEEAGGFLNWLGFGGENDVVRASYRILVQDTGNAIEIRLVSMDGDSLERALTLKLLNIVRSNMS
jgi:outer membrane protein assembly factor BamC